MCLRRLCAPVTSHGASSPTSCLVHRCPFSLRLGGKEQGAGGGGQAAGDGGGQRSPCLHPFKILSTFSDYFKCDFSPLGLVYGPSKDCFVGWWLLLLLSSRWLEGCDDHCGISPLIPHGPTRYPVDGRCLFTLSVLRDAANSTPNPPFPNCMSLYNGLFTTWWNLFWHGKSISFKKRLFVLES